MNGAPHLRSMLREALREAQAWSDAASTTDAATAILRLMVRVTKAGGGVLMLPRENALPLLLEATLAADGGIGVAIVDGAAHATNLGARRATVPVLLDAEAGHPARLLVPFLWHGAPAGFACLRAPQLGPGLSEPTEMLLDALAIGAATALETVRERERLMRTEASLRSARAELSRATHLTAIGEFAASLGHEINQPLTGIVLHANASLRWLNRAPPDLEEVRKGLESIREAGDRATTIVRMLRRLARKEAPQLERVGLDALVEEVLRLVGPEIAARGVGVARPGADAGIAVMADRAQLVQVLLNLIANALDALAESGVPQRLLEIGLARNGGEGGITIRDNGPGIPEGTHFRVFDPLFTTKAEGMGMGLAICRTIIEAHDGRLWAESPPQGGTIMHIALPLVPEPA